MSSKCGWLGLTNRSMLSVLFSLASKPTIPTNSLPSVFDILTGGENQQEVR